MLRVYLIQTDSAKGTKSENLARAKGMILDAHPSEGSLVLLPEMFATGYLPASLDDDVEDFSSSDSGETACMLSEAATATSCTVMGAGIKKAGDKFLNHVSVYTPHATKEFCGYDKMNLFFPEKDSFNPGDKINLFKTKHWKVASFICYDLRFPELFREATKQGANLITVQAAWPAKRIEHWETLLKARAIENQVPSHRKPSLYRRRQRRKLPSQRKTSVCRDITRHFAKRRRHRQSIRPKRRSYHRRTGPASRKGLP